MPGAALFKRSAQRECPVSPAVPSNTGSRVRAPLCGGRFSIQVTTVNYLGVIDFKSTGTTPHGVAADLSAQLTLQANALLNDRVGLIGREIVHAATRPLGHGPSLREVRFDLHPRSVQYDPLPKCHLPLITGERSGRPAQAVVAVLSMLRRALHCEE